MYFLTICIFLKYPLEKPDFCGIIETLWLCGREPTAGKAFPMKRLYQLVRDILMQTATITTVLIFAILIFMTLAGNQNLSPALTLPTAFLCLIVAFLLSLCNLLFRIRSISLFVRTLLHFLACLTSVVLCVTLGNYEFKSSSLLLILVYAILYLVIVPPALLIGNSIHKRMVEEDDYDSIFSDRK